MGSATTVFTMQVSLLIVIVMVGVATASTWQAAPYTLLRERRAAQRTRFFTGNSLPTRYSTLAPGAAPGWATRTPTTGSSGDRLSRMGLWALLLDLLVLPLHIMLWAVLVADSYHVQSHCG